MQCRGMEIKSERAEGAETDNKVKRRKDTKN